MTEKATATNASLGIKKVYLSQILIALASLLSVICTCFFSDNQKMLAVLGAIVAVFGIVAFVLEFLGLKKASHDEDGYRTAFYLMLTAVAAVAVNVVISIIWPVHRSMTADDMVYRIISVFVCYYVIVTTVARLKARGHEEAAELGRPALYALYIGYAAEVAVSLIAMFVRKDSLTMDIANCASAGLSTAATLYYAAFLEKSWKLL